MLSIMALVDRDAGPAEIAPDATEDARRQLFDRYVTHVLSRHRGAARYDAIQTRRSLAWLAGRMQAGSQTVFYPDQLQADWLSPTVRRRYALFDRLGGALLGGLALSLAYLIVLGLYALFRRPHPVYAEGLLQDTLAVMLLGGLVGGLFGAVNEQLHPGGAIWPQARERILGCLLGGLLFGCVAAAMTGSLAGAITAAILGAAAGTLAPLPSLRPRRVTIVEPRRWSWRRTLRLLPACLGGGATLGLLIGGLIGEIDGLLGPLLGPVGGSVAAGLLTGLGVSLAFGLSHTEAMHEPDRPNQGIRRSLHNGLLAGGLGFLLGGLLGLYVAVGPVTWLIMGVQGALVGALGFGLFTVLSHSTLRVVLWQSGAAPLRYLRFLDHCVERILLRRIGGGYSFVHIELQRYFAGLEEGPGTATRQVTGAAGEHRRSWRLHPVLADVAGLVLLTTILCGTLTIARERVAGGPPELPPAALRIEPGPGYTGRIISAYAVEAGDQVRLVAHGLIDIGTYERNVPPQGRERGFMGSPLGDSFKLVRDYPTGALLCKVTGEDESLWRLCGPEATFEAEAAGQLEFLINDNAIAKHAGAFGVVISIGTASE